MTSSRPLLGLVPAAGRATRLPGIDGSKELVPVPGPLDATTARPVVEHLLSAMAAAGVERAYVVLRTGKWDVVEHLTAAPPPGLRLAWVTTPGTRSIPASLDVAYPFVRDATVVTGFADSCFTPLDALARAVERHRRGGAAATLALFPSDRPDKTDMVEVDGERVTGLRVKPGDCGLEYTFGGAVWGPEITELVHELAPRAPSGSTELQVSQVLGAALEAGLRIDGERFPAGRYVDVGTPGDLARVRAAGVEG